MEFVSVHVASFDGSNHEIATAVNVGNWQVIYMLFPHFTVFMYL